MKTRIFLLSVSLLFISIQFFGQSYSKSVSTVYKTSATVKEYLQLNENNKAADTPSTYKSTSEITEALKLTLTCDANSYYDETIVIFNNSDPSQGAVKFMSMYATAPELWSVKNGLNYSINFEGGLDSTICVPITVKAGVSGNYTLSYTEIASFGSNIEISLEDRTLDSWINLGILPEYTFQVSEAATISDRFFIHFVDLTKNPTKTITSVSGKEVVRPFNIYATDGAIIITSLQQQSGKVAVFDMAGRTVATGRIKAGATTQIEIHRNTGAYIVSVLTDKGISNTKIIVK